MRPAQPRTPLDAAIAVESSGLERLVVHLARLCVVRRALEGLPDQQQQADQLGVALRKQSPRTREEPESRLVLPGPSRPPPRRLEPPGRPAGQRTGPVVEA